MRYFRMLAKLAKLCMMWTPPEPETCTVPDMVSQAFEKAASSTEHGHLLLADGLQRILVEVQNDASESVKADEIIRSIVDQRKHPGRARAEGITREEFLLYLHNPDNTPPYVKKLSHDMTAPMNEYYIWTGHNSYLTGNQISSKSSAEPIRKALRSGLRVIELDIWPSGEEIVILHGHTLTSSVKFEECLRAIKEEAFVASEYPVIVTLEDHLPRELHPKAAKTLKQVFGKQLYIPRPNDFLEFPSPASLKRRIIISTNPPAVRIELEEPSNESLQTKPLKRARLWQGIFGKRTNKNVDSQPPDPFRTWGEELAEVDNTTPGTYTQAENNGSGDEADTYTMTEKDVAYGASGEYRSTILIHAEKPKGSLRQSFVIKEKKAKRLSLSELELNRAALKYPQQLIRFSHVNLLRIYPRGTRVQSTNFNPMTAWIHGAQMAAINMQTSGRELWLVHGFFKANGGCGYLKKPRFLLSQGENKDGNSETGKGEPQVCLPPKLGDVTWPVKMVLKIRILLGKGWLDHFGKHHFDRYSDPDFYVKVCISGVPDDVKMETLPKVMDTFSPSWEEQECVFRLKVPELALLRIEVHEHDNMDVDDFGGQTVLPVSELLTGFRCLQLYDQEMKELGPVSLLTFIKKELPQPAT